MAGIFANTLKKVGLDGLTDKAIKYYNKAISMLGAPGRDEDIEVAKERGQVVNYDTGATKFAAKDGNAEMYMTKNMAMISADPNTTVAAADGCIVLDGRLHLTASPNKISINGFWKMNEELLTTVPSTLANPVQTLLFQYPPYAKKASNVAGVVTKAMG